LPSSSQSQTRLFNQFPGFPIWPLAVAPNHSPAAAAIQGR
jgi:hypothetical protein